MYRLVQCLSSFWQTKGVCSCSVYEICLDLKMKILKVGDLLKVRVDMNCSTKHIFTGHNRHPLHGIGKSWSRNEVERLFRRLVLESYLQEDMVITRDEMAFAYLRPGTKCQQFLNNASAKVVSLDTFA